MQITLEIPDRIADRLAEDRETLTRRFLELVAIEAYEKGLIGAGEVGQMLGFTSRWETYDFLDRECAEPPYTETDLESDRIALQNLLDW